jgi:ribosomal protein L37E
MPLPDGTLTDDEFARAVFKLHELWTANGGREPCRSCGEPSFFIHPALIGNRSDTLSPAEAHTRQPTVMVYCKRCGLADHHVAAVLGIEALKAHTDKPADRSGDS